MSQVVPATFMRRLGAMFYDSLLVSSAVIVVGFLSMLVLMKVTGIEEIQPGDPITKLFFPYLLFLGYLFFGWFWTHGGQTLGMRAWKLEVVTFNGKRITWVNALFRYIYAIVSWVLLGLGFLWILFDKNKFALHDYLSKTAIVIKDS